MAHNGNINVTQLQQTVLSALASVGQQGLGPGTRKQLFDLCSDPDVLVCLAVLADRQLELIAEDAGLDLWQTDLQNHVVHRLYNPHVIQLLRCEFLYTFPFADIQPPVRAAAQAEGVWASDAWVIAMRVATVLRGALCGAGSAPAAAPDIVPEAAMHLAAVLTCVSCDIIMLIWNYALDYDWLGEDWCGLPLHLLHTLLLEVQTVVHAVHMCHSLLVKLSPRAFELVANVMSKLLALSVPSFMPFLLEAGSTGTSVPSSSGTPGGSGCANQSTGSGAEAGPSTGPVKASKGKGKGKTKGKASKAQQGSSQPPAAAGSGTTAAGAAVAALALESPADREVRIMGHDARGLIVAAVDAWALSVNICRQLGRIAWGDDKVTEMAHKTAYLLSELILVPPPSLPEALQHQAELKPITWAAQIYKGWRKQGRAVLAPTADCLWRPTCLSIGPAPMATAGAESVHNLAAIMRLSPHKVQPEDVIGCLRLTVTLTILARRMAQEAAEPAFKDHIAMSLGDVHALRSWCATTGAMCRVAYCQLAALQHINNGGKLGEGAIPEQFQGQSYPLRREAQDQKKPHALPSQEVQALLPVMGASALQLAHAALACVRIMDSKIIAPDGAVHSGASVPLESGKTSSAEVYSAQVAALELYVKLLSCAADKYIHAADAPAVKQVPAAGGKQLVPSASSSRTAASLPEASVGSPAGTEPSGEKGPERQLHVLPPSFARHCAAITAWGSSIRHLVNIAVFAVMWLNSKGFIGASEALASWLTSGTRNQQNLEIIELLASFAMYGEDLMEVTNGDLAGWMGDLAPRGDLSSSHLLYRMCCLWACPPIIEEQMAPGPHAEAWKAAQAGHHMLLPLLVLAYQVPRPEAEVPGPGGDAQQQQGSRSSAASSRSSSATAAAAKRAQQARDAFRAAVMSSPMCLCAMFALCQPVPGMMQSVFAKVEQRVWREGDTEGWIHARIQSWIAGGGLDNSSLSVARSEPLPKLLKGEEYVWSAAWWEHNYGAKEEGQHIKRLQAYVQAAADRAAEQLQVHPVLIESLREALQS